METEELIKLVDGIYKNILDKFNPGARQMINAGKAYLKALHGAAAASRLYVDAINKLAKQAQQGTWGGCSDVGAALMKIVEVYKEIQDQQMNILKAFYVDLLVPLETNLEKDTKVVQSEQKRFLQQHKQRAETYSKAAAMMKKQRKKSRSSTKTGLAMDKELKHMQVLEEEKTKLDAFCEQSLKNAMTQERRRYGFVLERQCSLAKHYLSYHNHASNTYQQNLDKWSEVAKTREFLPESVENIFTNRLRQISAWQDDEMYSNPRSPHFDEDRISIASQLRKTKSMDASCLDIRSIGDVGSPVTTLSRAKSEYNLNSSNHSLEQDETPTRRPKSMVVPPVPPPQWDTQLARALYAYLSSGENQLSFLEGDLIALIGERNKGWQFGENLRTQCSGWFPLAYTEVLDDSAMSPSHVNNASTSGGTSGGGNNSGHQSGGGGGSGSGGNSSSSPGNTTAETANPTPRMFGDTLHLHRSSANAKQIRRAIGSNNIPPPALPAPVPTPSLPSYHKTGMTQSQSANFAAKPGQQDANQQQQPPTQQSQYQSSGGLKTSTSTFNFSTHPQPSRSDHRPVAPLPLHLQQAKNGGSKSGGGPVGNVSLHSSNDSGFSNDPPPQPEIDYSDDDSIPGQQTKLPARSRKLRREVNSDDTNATQTRRRMQPIRQSSSSGNLIDKRYYISDEDRYAATIGNRKGLVKRTKSFWRFGRNGSDNEILEGMALWRHRDLVDVDEAANSVAAIRTLQKTTARKQQRPSRDASNDSDKTLLHVEEEKKKTMPKVDKDQFYDEDVMRTVNRKNILQQYTNDSTGPDTDTESITSDDPYDCIVVDDQTTKRNNKDFSNVAAIGRKLEKLSKNSKYPPGKQDTNNNHSNGQTKNNNQTHRNDKNNAHSNTNKSANNKMSEKKGEEIMQYKRHNETRNTENGEKEVNENYYAQRTKRNNEINAAKDNKRRNYYETNNRTRQSYDSIDSELDHQKNKRANGIMMRRGDKNNEMMKYKETSTNDEFSDATTTTTENRQQFLPRTKLTKTNSGNSNKYDAGDASSLTDYGETLQRRLKNNEYGSKMDEKHNGNMYGPWYDLWGLDASVRK